VLRVKHRPKSAAPPARLSHRPSGLKGANPPRAKPIVGLCPDHHRDTMQVCRQRGKREYLP